MALLVLALLLGTTASPTPTLLRVLPSYGRAERALFGVNWEGVVKGTSWLNVTATGIHGVPDWVSQQQPLLSPKLLYGLRTLRVRSLRYPGGAPSNYFNWSNSSFVPPERCNDHPGPGGCAIYWPTQVAANQYFPRHALGWSSFAALLEAVNATGVWCLDIVNSSPHETLQALLALQDAGSADRRLEIGETSSFCFSRSPQCSTQPDAKRRMAWWLQSWATKSTIFMRSCPCFQMRRRTCSGWHHCSRPEASSRGCLSLSRRALRFTTRHAGEAHKRCSLRGTTTPRLWQSAALGHW